MDRQSSSFVVVTRFLHLVLTKQHISTFYDFVEFRNFQEFVIWLAPEHQFWRRCFMSIFVSGALVLAK